MCVQRVGVYKGVYTVTCAIGDETEQRVKASGRPWLVSVPV